MIFDVIVKLENEGHFGFRWAPVATSISLTYALGMHILSAHRRSQSVCADLYLTGRTDLYWNGLQDAVDMNVRGCRLPQVQPQHQPHLWPGPYVDICLPLTIVEMEAVSCARETR